MECGSSLFKKHCQKVIEKLTVEDVTNIKNAESDENRIKIIHSFAQNIPCTLNDSGKSTKEALAKKKSGNDFFSKRDYPHALAEYNHGIRKCNQNEGKIYII